MDSTLEVLFILCMIISFYYVTQMLRNRNDNIEEGFTQNAPFETKQDKDIYDEFYASVYDRLYKTKAQTKYDLMNVIKITQPSENSVFLDIGSGTGKMVDRLEKKGFGAYGIDSSQAMIDYASKKYPQSEFKCCNAKQTMEFDPETFSHILCTNFTIYEIPDKTLFFKNCFRWLKIGGYLILHLVDKTKFDTIAPIAKKQLTYPDKNTRILKSKVKTKDFVYTSEYSFLENDRVKQIETFVNKISKVRHNETVITMDSRESIIKIAKMNGFSVKGHVNYSDYNDDSHQYLYFFEKIDV